MAKTKTEKVSVLAFEKKLVPSDGYLYGTKWADRDGGDPKPLMLVEKSVRGTISNRLKPAIQNDPAKLNNEVEKPNLQRVDACALSPEDDTLVLQFSLKVLGGIHKPSACNNANFHAAYNKAAKQYTSTEAFRELAHRYATNIANARILWRNRIGAESIEVEVTATNHGSQVWRFDALKYSTRHFEDRSPDVSSLAEKIGSALASEDDFLVLNIKCFAKVGVAQDVYPSEELVLDKGKGEKSKVLYAVNGTAALHSQKIGNALRTIDTWYPDFDDDGASAGPIAIEPYGAVTNLGKAFRTPKDKKDFYTFFDKWAWGEQLEANDEHYVMAVLVRGGVFGESEK